MYGVILWSDPEIGQAVIWCEDRGDLVFYQAPPRSWHVRRVFFDTGDYVEFDVTNDTRPRRARNAQTVMSAQSPRVADTLHGGDAVPRSNGRGVRGSALGGVAGS
jgi:hypothetical protein